MWFLGKRARRARNMTHLQGGSLIIPPSNESVPNDFIGIPKADIPQLASAYVAAMETQRTMDWCKCGWKPYPGDEQKPKGTRKMIRSAPADDCPVHTKEGFISYFFEWMMKHG